jgi:hypothetical protein
MEGARRAHAPRVPPGSDRASEPCRSFRPRGRPRGDDLHSGPRPRPRRGKETGRPPTWRARAALTWSRFERS